MHTSEVFKLITFFKWFYWREKSLKVPDIEKKTTKKTKQPLVYYYFQITERSEVIWRDDTPSCKLIYFPNSSSFLCFARDVKDLVLAPRNITGATKAEFQVVCLCNLWVAVAGELQACHKQTEGGLFFLLQLIEVKVRFPVLVRVKRHSVLESVLQFKTIQIECER